MSLLFPNDFQLVPVKFDKNDYLAVKKYATKKGMPTSTYIRMVVMDSIPEVQPTEERIIFSKTYMIKVAEQATTSKREQFINILQQYNIPIGSQIDLRLKKHGKDESIREEEDNKEY